jgi:hypothetical protein
VGNCGGYGRDGEDGGRTCECILNAINPSASKKPRTVRNTYYVLYMDRQAFAYYSRPTVRKSRGGSQ